ncbi:hypothetical protein APR11_001989 [Nocardia amikacinitolerans]|uniref:DUF7373 family lipoprotein n=1 Tax=Nocardia amikacinitolerans TaxID=756689 RepID=UPI0020A29C3B|nr:hypothetical protein [Nocardia amikacinitolerans]MCP2295571.1 hypothetical protein [Nocardia amikacinitolerans]
MNLAARSAAHRAVVAMLACGTLIVGASACGSEVSGTPTRVQADLSKLDVGNYQTEPKTIGNAKNERQARSREAQRLADYVALPFEADPAYVVDAWFIQPHIVLNRKALGSLVINDTFDDVAKDLVAGWVNSWSTGGGPDTPRRTMNIAVLMFPDANIAKAVGPALEHDDFTYNRDNEPVQITKHPATTAHWRPGVSSIGSWTVHDRYVIFIKVVDDTAAPDLPSLVGHVERMLDVQIPLLAKFEPTPAAELSRIPLDPEGLLGRTLPSHPERPHRAEPDGTYTGRGAATLISGTDLLDEFERAEVDLVSFGDAVVFRSRTSKGAEVLWELWQPSKHLESDEVLLTAPSGVGDRAECYSDAPKEGSTLTPMNICVLQVDRYTVQAYGKQLQDVHQIISAQYVLLTHD